MEEFRKELDALLIRYPDIGSFVIRVQPRLLIDIPPKTLEQPEIPTKELKKVFIGSAGNAGTINHLEAGITPAKIKELSKSSIIES